MADHDGYKPNAPLTLSVLDQRLAICRLDARAETPLWATAPPFSSVTRTPDELSIVCPEEAIPAGVTRERGWRALKLEGPLDLSLVGVLVSVAAPLAKSHINIFAVSTHDTDYVLVEETRLDAAAAALSESGHDVRGAGPFTSIRLATGEDEHFIWEMLAEAAHEPGGARAVAENPGAARYAECWGREADLGFVAVSPDGELAGAAWLRLLAGDSAGYGYVDDDIPELAIAVHPEHRGAGIGTRLLARLLEAAKARYSSVSLSVRTDNPAQRLYKRMGFEVVEGGQKSNRTGGTSITMKVNLTHNPSAWRK